MDLYIDPEFQALIPALTPEERQQLEDNLRAEGCRDPLVLWQGTLIDGHNRYAICTQHGIAYQTVEYPFPDRDAVKVWIIRNQFGRRNLSAYQRGVLALQLKDTLTAQARERQTAHLRQGEDAPVVQNFAQREGRTVEQLGDIAGISRGTIQKIEYIERTAPAEVKAQLQSGDVSIHAAYTAVRREAREQERESTYTQLRQTVQAVPVATRYRLLAGDLAEVGYQIEAETVDVILTDPPYPREYLPVYEDLAHLAAYALKPGGSIFVMIGQSYLPDILALMTPYLTYHWTLAYLTPGGQAVQLWQRKVNTFWKPIIWLVKGAYAGEWLGDVTRSEVNDNDKRFHHWGQSVSGISDLVERCTRPGDTILDPFVGGGTVGAVAVAKDRYFIGIDKDVTALDTTRARIAQLQEIAA